jgi:hypothetical protein
MPVQLLPLLPLMLLLQMLRLLFLSLLLHLPQVQYGLTCRLRRACIPWP